MEERRGFSAAERKREYLDYLEKMAVKITSGRRCENYRTKLMGRVRRAGDEKAFDELYRRYARRLHGFFLPCWDRKNSWQRTSRRNCSCAYGRQRGRYECGRELCPWFSRWPITHAGMNIVSGILRWSVLQKRCVAGRIRMRNSRNFGWMSGCSTANFPHCWTSCLQTTCVVCFAL